MKPILGVTVWQLNVGCAANKQSVKSTSGLKLAGILLGDEEADPERLIWSEEWVLDCDRRKKMNFSLEIACLGEL